MGNRRARSIGFILACLALCLATATIATAQEPQTENVEVDPIACYWRTSTDAIRVGEPFTLALTCSVIDTSATTVVPDQSRLDPGVLQLQPFEIIGGSQAPDLRTPLRRYFQYEYRLRYVGEEVGRDLQLPALTLTYRVQSRVQSDSTAVEGRERQYILPARTVRILSIVPAAARDIRDAQPVTLADIDARRFRASMFRLAAVAFYVLGAVVAAWAVVALVRRRRTSRTTVVRHASDAAILGGALKELADVRRATREEGWTDAHAARALAALRIAASYEAGLKVAQAPAQSPAVPLLPGQIRLRGGVLGGSPVVVSGGATSVLLARTREANPTLGASQLARIEALESAMTEFSGAAYGRQAATSGDRLDAALSDAEREVSAIRRQHSWLATWMRSLRTRAGERVKAQAWQRS